MRDLAGCAIHRECGGDAGFIGMRDSYGCAIYRGFMNGMRDLERASRRWW